MPRKAIAASDEISRAAQDGAEALQRDAEAGAAALQIEADEADRELKKHISPVWDRPRGGEHE